MCGKVYHCNLETYQCELSPSGIPHDLCTEYCTPGNYTPIGLIGVWRGLQINTGFTMGEWQLQFNGSDLTMRLPDMSFVEGELVFLTIGATRMANWTVARSNATQFPVGTIVQLGFTYDTVSPELRYILLAFDINSPPPTTWAECVAQSTGFCGVMTACQPDTNCMFTFGVNQPQGAAVARSTDSWAHRAWERLKGNKKPAQTSNSKTVQMQVQEDEPVGFVPSDDPCNPYTSCETCRAAHPQCGWCTGRIVYADGTLGSQCGGGGYSNISFNCVNGTYHADSCNDYACVEPAGVCDIVPLGHGISKEECEYACKAGPAPPGPPPPPAGPAAGVYCCNHTTYQCYGCPNGSPGAASHQICDAQCKPIPPAHPSAPTTPTDTYICNTTLFTCQNVGPNGGGTSMPVCVGSCPHPPPTPPVLVGNWRGLMVNNGYSAGEFDLNVYQNSSFSLLYNGNVYGTGVIHADADQGSLVLVLNSATQTIVRPAIYAQNLGFVGQYINLVIGSTPTDVPTGWDLPWILGGTDGSEFMFFRPTAPQSPVPSNFGRNL
jgi:hypothetical protein